MKEPTFNPHNKKEYPPMHTVEHLINGAMVRLFDTGRSVSAHVERKKSRMDFRLPFEPSDEDARRLEAEVNAQLRADLPVSFVVTTQKEAEEQYGVDLSRIPEEATDSVQLALIGDYDVCLCIGDHVEHTAQCGTLEIYSHSYDSEKERWRIRFRLSGEDPQYSEE